MPFYTMPDQEKLFVRRVGEGEPVLVLSGLGMQSWQWLPFFCESQKIRIYYSRLAWFWWFKRLCYTKYRCHFESLE
jgi:hypothetical protein